MELLMDSQKIHEECGVIGIYSPEGHTVTKDIYYGLIALQHRGQESAGISVSDTEGPKGNMETHKEIRWGFIGCGEVTEKKSGPAFSLVPGSSVVAVMSRNADKARSYASRHNIPHWKSSRYQVPFTELKRVCAMFYFRRR